MSLPHRQRRLLRRMDRALCRSDPDLASLLSLFALLSAEETLPHWEQLPYREQLTRRQHLCLPRPWTWRLLLWPAAGAAFLAVCVAGGGLAAARRAASAYNAASMRLIDGFRGFGRAAAAPRLRTVFSDLAGPPLERIGAPAVTRTSDAPAGRRAQLRRLIVAIRDSDRAVVDEAVLRLSRSRRWLAPLALAVGAVAMLLEGVKLLFTNWRLTLIQVCPRCGSGPP